MLRLFSKRIRAFAQLVEERAAKDVVARVAALLLEEARGEGPLIEADARTSGRLTHQSVAGMIGTVREVAQRALKVLESEGAVTLARGRIQIAKPDVLERMSAASRPTRPRLSGPRP